MLSLPITYSKSSFFTSSMTLSRLEFSMKRIDSYLMIMRSSVCTPGIRSSRYSLLCSNWLMLWSFVSFEKLEWSRGVDSSLSSSSSILSSSAISEFSPEPEDSSEVSLSSFESSSSNLLLDLLALDFESLLPYFFMPPRSDFPFILISRGVFLRPLILLCIFCCYWSYLRLWMPFIDLGPIWSRFGTLRRIV